MFLAGYLGGLVLLLFGYASPHLPPESFWWTGLFASVLPYLTAVAFALSLVVWVLFRGYWYAPVLLILTLAGARYVTWSRIKPVSESSGDDLVVMTYNAPVRGPNPDTLSAITVRLIDRVEPDILALQEPMIWIREDLPVRQATAHLQAVIDSLSYWAPTPRKGRDEATLTQPVVARFALGTPAQYASPAREESLRPTYVTRVPFSWQGRRAVLYNVHLYTTGEVKPWEEEVLQFDPRAWYQYLLQYRDAYLRRVVEARRLRELIDREDLPVIVAGDFNSTIHHWELRHIAQGLTDAFTARGQGWGGTYHRRWPLFRIDHILVSPEWEVVSASVPRMPTLSDHRPVVARVRWRDGT